MWTEHDCSGAASICPDASVGQRQESISSPAGGAGCVSFLTGDLRATVVIFVMVILGIVLCLVQESLAKFWARLFSKKRKRK